MADNVPVGGLSARQVRAISVLLTAESYEAAAQECGISRRTLQRWRQKPEFVAALSAAESDLIDDLLRRLLQGSDAALTALAGVVKEGQTDSARLRAAVSTLDLILRLWDVRLVDARLARLEGSLPYATYGSLVAVGGSQADAGPLSGE